MQPSPRDPRAVRTAIVVCISVPAIALGLATAHHALGAPFGPAFASELWYWAKMLMGWLLFGTPLMLATRRALGTPHVGPALDSDAYHAALEQSATHRIPTGSVRVLQIEGADDERDR